VVLVQSYREAGLAVANTLSAAFNTGLLLYALRRKLAKLEFTGLVWNLCVLLVAATIAGIAAYGAYRWWEGQFGHETVAVRLGAVFLPGAIAGGVYWLLAVAAKIPAATEIASLVRRKLRR